jgi:hypothetical protein
MDDLDSLARPFVSGPASATDVHNARVWIAAGFSAQHLTSGETSVPERSRS